MCFKVRKYVSTRQVTSDEAASLGTRIAAMATCSYCSPETLSAVLFDLLLFTPVLDGTDRNRRPRIILKKCVGTFISL